MRVIGAVEPRVAQIGEGEVGHDERGLGQIGAAQHAARQHRERELCFAEIAAGEVQVAQGCALPLRAAAVEPKLMQAQDFGELFARRSP